MSVIATDVTPGHLDELRQAVREIAEGGRCELPVLPEVAAQLLHLTSDIDCEIPAIVALIKRDQSLTGHLLRIANSLRYSTGICVSSVQQAVARLGLICVREIVVLIACQCRIFDVAGFEKDVRDSFRRSLGAAAFAQEIARIRRLNVEEAFLGGLLHEVGRPVLLQALSDRRRAERLMATDDELRQAAADHRVALSSRMIHFWELSERVAEAILFQDAPLTAPECAQQAAIIGLATRLSSATFDPDSEAASSELPEELLAFLNLYPEQVRILQQKRTDIIEWVNSTV